MVKAKYTIRKAYLFWKHYGLWRFLGRVVEVFRKHLNRRGIKIPVRNMAVHEILKNRFLGQNRFPVYSSGQNVGRITVVTDSLRKGSFFGGVATALIFSVLLSEKSEKKLRVITRTESDGKNNFLDLLEREGLKVTKNIEFEFCGYSKRQMCHRCPC